MGTPNSDSKFSAQDPYFQENGEKGKIYGKNFRDRVERKFSQPCNRRSTAKEIIFIPGRS